MQKYIIKIKEKTETEKEISINLPCYVKSGSGFHWYAIHSQTSVLSMFVGTTGINIGPCCIETALIDNYTIITEKEFCDKYKEVATKIYDDCDNFLNGVEDRRYEILSTPLPDHDYGDEQNIEFDRFMSKQNDYHERQNDAHVFREPGDSFY